MCDAPTHILLVEDDDALATLLMDYLNLHGFTLTHERRGEHAVGRIVASPPTLVLLDLMLPGFNGLDVCRSVRNVFDGAILMLTASQSAADHVTALELGCDDFVTKPIEPRVLLARIRTQLRRFQHAMDTPQTDGFIDAGPLRIDVKARDVTVDGQTVRLTTMEYDVLLMLAHNAGRVVGRDALYQELMGISYDGLDRGIDVHVSRIRRKLKHAGFTPRLLKSVRGVGYLLAAR
ncbi:MAG: response regulator transcription factor [Myxococcota bacterium]